MAVEGWEWTTIYNHIRNLETTLLSEIAILQAEVAQLRARKWWKFWA